jgi:hypothetical protein
MRSHTSFISPSLVVGAMALAASWAQAADVNPVLLTQPEFRLLSEDMGAVLSFKPMIPAESMGITGFDVGVALTGTKLENRAIWEKASNGSSVEATLPIATVRVHKGLPFDIDIGGSFAKVPSTNIQILGGELRWAILPGSTITPALAVRASVSELSGVDNLSLRTTGLDVSISKGFAFLTPYVGAGIVNVKSKPDAPGLVSESFRQNKVFAGMNLNFGLVNLVLEGDKTGEATSYGVKLGLRF